MFVFYCNGLFITTNRTRHSWPNHSSFVVVHRIVFLHALRSTEIFKLSFISDWCQKPIATTRYILLTIRANFQTFFEFFQANAATKLTDVAAKSNAIFTQEVRPNFSWTIRAVWSDLFLIFCCNLWTNIT